VSISVVFTDVRMPGSLDGVDLAKHIVSNYPRILVMITSGHVRAEDIPPGLPAPITKPYSLTKLVETINRHWSGKNE
jgi:two-component system, response regulator PdtaR